MTLKDRMAVVTGAGSGLGRAIAQELAAAGASVAAVDLDAATAEETVVLIAKAGGKGKAFQADTSKAADVDRAVGGAIKALGPLEIMVNNAGILDGYFNVDETDEAVWRRVIDIDLTGVFLGCKRALAEMLPRGRGRGIAVSDEQVRAVVPAGRRGTADEIASAVRFLASDEAKYITGHSLVVDGGWRAK